MSSRVEISHTKTHGRFFAAEVGEKPQDLDVDKLYKIVKEQGTTAIVYFRHQLPQLTNS